MMMVVMSWTLMVQLVILFLLCLQARCFSLLRAPSVAAAARSRILVNYRDVLKPTYPNKCASPTASSLQCGHKLLNSDTTRIKAVTIEEAKTFLVSDLKAALEERGAPVNGNKPDLLARLVQLITEENIIAVVNMNNNRSSCNSSTNSSSISERIRDTEDAIIASLSTDGFVAHNVRERERRSSAPEDISARQEKYSANDNVGYDDAAKRKEENGKKLTQVNESTLHIANFPKNFSQEKLEQLFGEYHLPSTISLDYVKGTDKIRGGFKYFAFARFTSTDDANAALLILDKITFDGVKLKVDHYLPRTQRMAKQSYIVPDNCVFLKNVHHSVNKQALVKVCDDRLGRNFIVAARLNNFPTDRLGCAYLYTKTSADAVHAAEVLDGMTGLSPAVDGNDNRPMIAVRAELHHQSREILNRKMESILRMKGRTVPSEHSVVLLNLAFELTADMIREMLEDCLEGDYVQEVTMPRDSRGRLVGSALVEFSHGAAVKRTLNELQGMLVLDRPLSIYEWPKNRHSLSQ